MILATQRLERETASCGSPAQPLASDRQSEKIMVCGIVKDHPIAAESDRKYACFR